MVRAVGLPLAVNIGMLAGSKNITTGGNFSISIGTTGIAGIAFFPAGSIFCITHLCMLVIRGI